MFNLFAKKCPVCKMKLDGGRKYPEGYEKKFCSEGCKTKYEKELGDKQSENSDDCCH